MKKKFLATILIATLALSMTACGGGETKVTGGNASVEENAEKTSDDTEKEAESEDITYQDILDDYTKKIEDATPGLVEEYNTESEEYTGDIQKLAELSNSKVEKLAEICNEGVQEMAELMNKNGDTYETYEEWAGKLQDVYTEYATQITEAYTNSAI